MASGGRPPADTTPVESTILASLPHPRPLRPCSEKPQRRAPGEVPPAPPEQTPSLASRSRRRIREASFLSSDSTWAKGRLRRGRTKVSWSGRTGRAATKPCLHRGHLLQGSLISGRIVSCAINVAVCASRFVSSAGGTRSPGRAQVDGRGQHRASRPQSNGAGQVTAGDRLRGPPFRAVGCALGAAAARALKSR